VTRATSGKYITAFFVSAETGKRSSALNEMLHKDKRTAKHNSDSISAFFTEKTWRMNNTIASRLIGQVTDPFTFDVLVSDDQLSDQQTHWFDVVADGWIPLRRLQRSLWLRKQFRARKTALLCRSISKHFQCLEIDRHSRARSMSTIVDVCGTMLSNMTRHCRETNVDEHWHHLC